MKAPFRVLFSNDTTNILTCTSPYHQAGEAFRPEMLEATVDEVADTGVDAHFIQLAHGQVPWYQSRVYSMADHVAWWKEYFGVDPFTDTLGIDSVHRYLLEGGDLLQVFIDRCRATGQTPFVSMRLNDVHFVNHVHEKGNTTGFHCISRFYAEHLDCRLGDDLSNWLQRTLDWSRADVRAYIFSLIEEQCERYDIDGFELDFMRFPSFFRGDRTTTEERARIMTGFVGDVRKLLDRTARDGRHRWLCVRIPAFQCTHDGLGIDLPRWVEAGVEMVNLSYHYFTEQDGDYQELRNLVPDVAMYVEMTHATAVGPIVTDREGDNFAFRRTTQQQFQTTAHLAYARGLDGVSVFNFVYYRAHGGEARGPFHEPPFDLLQHLGDAEWLAHQPQHYFLGNVWNSPYLEDRPLPRRMLAGQTATFRLEMASPEGNWRKDGRLRIQCSENLRQSNWHARFNGTPLSATDDHSEPFDNPYPSMLGSAEQHRAWTVPWESMRDGPNEVDIVYVEGPGPSEIVFVDVAVE